MKAYLVSLCPPNTGRRAEEVNYSQRLSQAKIAYRVLDIGEIYSNPFKPFNCVKSILMDQKVKQLRY
jgi:hypothetical protein